MYQSVVFFFPFMENSEVLTMTKSKIYSLNYVMIYWVINWTLNDVLSSCLCQ